MYGFNFGCSEKSIDYKLPLLSEIPAQFSNYGLWAQITFATLTNLLQIAVAASVAY